MTSGIVALELENCCFLGIGEDGEHAPLVSVPEEELGTHNREDLSSRANHEEGCYGDRSAPGSSEDTSSSADGRDDDDDDEEPNWRDRSERSWCRILVAMVKASPSMSIATLLMGVLTVCLWTAERFRFITRSDRPGIRNNSMLHQMNGKGRGDHTLYPAFPAKALLGITIKTTPKPANIEPPYDPGSDFQYEKKGRTRTLLYWEDVLDAIEGTQDMIDGNFSSAPYELVDLWMNMSNWGPCYPRALPPDDNKHRMARVGGSHARNWTNIVLSNSDQIADEDSIIYPAYRNSHQSRISPEESLEGLCRPGFLIIGQGKCGTSSLYHYLTGHPRILPANKKQIHYFRYHKTAPLPWYYSHFPTIESFLGRGALMTGEASPGYMPYPEVVEAISKRLSLDRTSGLGEGTAHAWKGHASSLPKIIAIVRDPIERAISSYEYNYVEPALKTLRSGMGVSASGKHIPRMRTERYYRERHLFTFEELARSELATLRECLAPGGGGESYSRERYGKVPGAFFYNTIRGRNESAPLVHLDGACYAKTKSRAVPRAQWIDLAREHPDKVLQVPNLQLTQSIIGRGVYVLALEWWYEVFSDAAANKEDRIHVVCTEDMAESPENLMDDLTRFLGLPQFDFHNVTNVGRYNVGGHRGYDTVTESRGEFDEKPAPNLNVSGDLVTISNALKKELHYFYHPYNERLFRLIGKRCPWK